MTPVPLPQPDDPGIDALTGLPSRAWLLERIAARRTAGEAATLLMIGTDGIGKVNDAYGYQAGDELLRHLARTLTDLAPEAYAIARVYGCEFAVLIPGEPDRDGLRLARRIDEELTAPTPIAGHQVTVRAGIGLTGTGPEAAANADAALQQADWAMNVARKSESSAWHIYSPEGHEAFTTALATSAALPGAWDRGEFSVAYQPIVRLDDGVVVAFEALARWKHPQLGTVPPSDFIPLAESADVIDALGEWMLRTACADLARWRARDVRPEPAVSVNVSTRQLLGGGLADTVLATLAAAKLPPAALTLEITEGATAEPQLAAAELAHLHEAGVRIAVDDFGAGLSSLHRLTQLPLSIIKVDKSLVDDLGRADSAEAVIMALLGLAQRLGLAVVAEGIETPEQRFILAGLGCPYGQGFLFGRPAPAASVPPLLIGAADT